MSNTFQPPSVWPAPARLFRQGVLGVRKQSRLHLRLVDHSYRHVTNGAERRTCDVVRRETGNNQNLATSVRNQFVAAVVKRRSHVVQL